MAAELKAAGLEVTTGVGKTGVVGILKNGDGPLILLRADMDGLPVEEKTGLGYASKAKQVGEDGKEYPVMHACGHDVHITSLVGTARRLVAMKSQWKGTLMFIVQPAEEGVRGAKAMMEDGLYERFGKPDYALAFHVAAELETARFRPRKASSIPPRIRSIFACPHRHPRRGAASRRDPVYIASQVVTALQSIDSREISPTKPVVVTVGSFHAGSKHNIISDEAKLQVTVRANDEETREQVIATVERIAVNIARAHVFARLYAGHRDAPAGHADNDQRRRACPPSQRGDAARIGGVGLCPLRAEEHGGRGLHLFRRGRYRRAGVLLRGWRDHAGADCRGQGGRTADCRTPLPAVPDRPA
jgi:amidohydrolase